MNKINLVDQVRIGYDETTGKTLIQFLFGNVLPKNWPAYIKLCSSMVENTLNVDIHAIQITFDDISNSMECIVYKNMSAKEERKELQNILKNSINATNPLSLSKQSILHTNATYETYGNDIVVKFEYSSNIVLQYYAEYAMFLSDMLSKFNIYKLQIRLSKNCQTFEFSLRFKVPKNSPTIRNMNLARVKSTCGACGEK